MNVSWLYEQLGIALGFPYGDEAPVRCFAGLEEHRREDRRPSASVNLTGGAWFCHGCGRGGGPYDAAVAVGRTPRQAMDLLRAAGLDDRARTRHSGGARSVASSARMPSRAHATLDVDEWDVTAWSRALEAAPVRAQQVLAARGFTIGALLRHGVGWDGLRLTLPIRDADGRLEGLVRYTPWPRAGAPKALAVRGSRRDLFPAPERVRGEHLILCEGEPDALALLSLGIPAVAIPGVGTWRRADAHRLRGRSVTVIFDCDAPGRAAASLVSERLRQASVDTRTVDLAPERQDGFDVTDALRRPGVALDLLQSAGRGVRNEE